MFLWPGCEKGVKHTSSGVSRPASAACSRRRSIARASVGTSVIDAVSTALAVRGVAGNGLQPSP